MAAGRVTALPTFQVDMPNAGQEYSFEIPAGAIGFRLQPQGAGDIWISTEKGKSGIPNPLTGLGHWTVRQPPARPFDQFDLDLHRPMTIYFQSVVPGMSLEIMVLL